ncbi:MAG TPA: signal peptidase I [Gaiellaceae bacterium]|jgi:signal peptidase I|nr:signal peptidase I [Gaiellaceae bacterium]
MRGFRRAVLVLLVVAGGLFALVALTSKTYRVPSSAMEPTLHCPRPAAGCLADTADRIAVSRVLYKLRDPHRGDLAAFDTPARAEMLCGAAGVYVKRIVGLPGEMWRVQNGVVFIDGKRLSEPYVKPARRDRESFPPRAIPKDRYLMLGDNRASSCDSRRFGYVARADLIGPVVVTYWPVERISIR